MHCVLLADLAAILSQHGPAIIYRHPEIANEKLTTYWLRCRSRFDLWHRSMSRFSQAQASGDWITIRGWWLRHITMLEEVLVTEMLTRVVATLATEIDRGNDHDELSPVTHAVHVTHLEARNRVLRLMIDGRGCSVPDAVRLNRLRKGVERWTDALLGQIAVEDPSHVPYAIESDRASTHAIEMRGHGYSETRDTACWLMKTAMHDALRRRTSHRPGLPKANRRVADSISALFEPELFDDTGVLKSIWSHRIDIDTKAGPRCDEELMGDEFELEQDPIQLPKSRL